MKAIRTYSTLLVGLLFIFNCEVNAQTLKPVPISYFQDRVKQAGLEIPIPNYVNTFQVNVFGFYSATQTSPEWNFKYTLPKGAIFCRMEDAIYNKLNFWVKFRMGTDERYSN